MLLSVFLAFCVGLVTSARVNEIQNAEPGCACTKEPIPQCGCCLDFEFEEDQHKLCANVTNAVEGEKGLRITMILDGKVLVNETISGKNPSPFCQGPKPFAYVCVKYSNMSYGDDNLWGGCVEIYAAVVVNIIDLNFGCIYLPKQVHKKVVEKDELPPVMNRFMEFLKGAIVDEIQQWNINNFGRKRSGRRQLKKNGNLKNILTFKNRMDEEEKEGIEIPDIIN